MTSRTLALVACLAPILLAAADPPAGAPAPAAVAPRRDAAPVSALAFLAGTWKGALDGDFVEELWSAPHGTSMMGCFRWVGADGEASMFEILTISQEADATRLRLRHFTPTLGAKEASDKPMTLALAERTGSKAVFVAEKDAGMLSRIEYEVVGDELRIAVEFAPPASADETRRPPLRFALRRDPATAR